MLNPWGFKTIFDVICWLIPNIVWTSAETFFGHLWRPLRVVSVKTGQRNQRRFSEKSGEPERTAQKASSNSPGSLIPEFPAIDGAT